MKKRENQMYRTPAEKILEKSKKVEDAALERRETPLQVCAGCALGIACALAYGFHLLPIAWIAILGCLLSILAQCWLLRAAKETFAKALGNWGKGMLAYICFAALVIALLWMSDWLPARIIHVVIAYALAFLPAASVITPVMYLISEVVG